MKKNLIITAIVLGASNLSGTTTEALRAHVTKPMPSLKLNIPGVQVKNDQLVIQHDGKITQSKEKTVAPKELIKTINQLFNQRLKKHNINPAIVEKHMSEEMNKGKKTIVTLMQEKQEKTHRSEYLHKDVVELVDNYLKTFIPIVQHVLIQTWVKSLIADNKRSQTETSTPNCSVHWSKQTIDLYNSLTCTPKHRSDGLFEENEETEVDLDVEIETDVDVVLE